jgi:hypothetical protein
MMMVMVIVIMTRERQTLLTDCLTWGTSTGDGSAGQVRAASGSGGLTQDHMISRHYTTSPR